MPKPAFAETGPKQRADCCKEQSGDYHKFSKFVHGIIITCRASYSKFRINLPKKNRAICLCLSQNHFSYVSEGFYQKSDCSRCGSPDRISGNVSAGRFDVCAARVWLGHG